MLEFGMDEVGRGALAGPVVVGLVGLDTADSELLPQLLQIIRRPHLVDSKKLTALQRENAFEFLKSRVVWAIGEATPEEIDTLGLTKAITLAAGRAIEFLTVPIVSIRADAGLLHPFENRIETNRFVKGDEIYPEISLASIIAKVWRDRRMRAYSDNYPEYDFNHNAGYGTPNHYTALRNHGALPIHRQLFLRKLRLASIS